MCNVYCSDKLVARTNVSAGRLCVSRDIAGTVAASATRHILHITLYRARLSYAPATGGAISARSNQNNSHVDKSSVCSLTFALLLIAHVHSGGLQRYTSYVTSYVTRR